jgi:putative spermidine/putrescine transport system permease protein
VDSLIVTALAVVLGGVVAWSLRTTTRRGMRLFLLASVGAPLLLNSILKVFAFTVLFESNGLVNRTLLSLHIIHSPLNLLYNQFAVILGMLYYMFPYATLPLYVSFLSLDLDLVLVAETLGASRNRALLDTCLPLALPGILATLVIDYVLCLGFFVIPLLLGGISVPFTSNVVWQDVTDFFDLTDAAVSSLILLAAAIVVVAAGYIAVGRERLLRAVA